MSKKTKPSRTVINIYIDAQTINMILQSIGLGLAFAQALHM